MEITDPILGSPLFLAAVLLFLIVLPLALRQTKKTELDKIIARMEAEELKEAAREEAAQEKTGGKKDAGENDPEKSPTLTDQPSSLPSPKEIPPAPKKIKKVLKPGILISHNEENASLQKTSSTSTASSQGKKSSWDEDFNVSSKEDSGSNWVEAEIPGLIIEPFPAKKDSDTKPMAESPAPAEKKSPDKPEPKEILTFKAAPKAVEKKETQPPGSEEIPELGPKDVEIRPIVVSHKDIAKKEAGKGKAPTPPGRVNSTSGIAESVELEAGIEVVPPAKKDRKSAPKKPKPKPLFLDLKYLVEDELKAGPESCKKLSPGMMDRIVARLNELQNYLEHQLVSQPGKGGPAKRDVRQGRIQDVAPVTADAAEELSEKKQVSLEELDGFLFTANRKKSRE